MHFPHHIAEAHSRSPALQQENLVGARMPVALYFFSRGLLLGQHGLDKAQIGGYERVEFTHAAVAAYVASDMADASFGVEAAARQFDLDFVRLATEDYFFVCRKQMLENEAVKRILVILRSEEFNQAVAQLPGYTAKDAGLIMGVREALRTV